LWQSLNKKWNNEEEEEEEYWNHDPSPDDHDQVQLRSLDNY
jgi:hypothetical protein